MSSSGLIYAVIVGAWAAYLVPMWLRRQDELNEARPTERFSTAIRLLSGRAAMERRYARELQDRSTEEAGPADEPDAAEPTGSVDVRSFSAPPALTEARMEIHPEIPAPARPASGAKRPIPTQGSAHPAAAERRARPADSPAERARRAQRSQVLARRRRTTVVLFLAFTVGAIIAGVGGLGLLWAPAVPAVLLSVYIVHLRARERRRFVFTMDRRRAEIAAQRLRENRPRRHQAAAPAEPDEEPEPEPDPEPAPSVSPQEAGRRALVEQTDHAEWVDQQRQRGPARGESWEPVPVPLPTYVTAPVAPRATGCVNVSDPETWSAARSSTAEPTAPDPPPAEPPQRRTPPPPRRARDHGRTPLFDQHDGDDRPRAANE